MKTKDLIHPDVLNKELNTMELHFTKLLDENVVIFQLEEAKLNGRINELKA